jgi:hypothetical protein
MVADFGEPEFDGLGLGAGDALDKAEEGLRFGDCCRVVLPVGRLHFELVTICNQLAALLFEPVLQHLPIILRGLVIRLLREHLNDVYDRKPPGFGFFVIDATDFVAFEDGEVFIHDV